MKTQKLFSILFVFVIMFSLMSPALASDFKVEKTEPENEQYKLEKRALVKENVNTSEFTKEALGHSKVKSKDIELMTAKTNGKLKISSVDKIKDKSKDSHDILIPVSDVRAFNGHSVRVDHYTDAGKMDYQYIQDVAVVDGYIVLPDVEFSSVIVAGFTGYRERVLYNQDLSAGVEVSNIDADRIDVDISGVGSGIAIQEGVLETYPEWQNAEGIWDFNVNSLNLVTGTVGTDTNVSYSNGSVYLNGIDSKIVTEQFSLSNRTMIVLYSTNEPNVGSVHEEIMSFGLDVFSIYKRNGNVYGRTYNGSVRMLLESEYDLEDTSEHMYVLRQNSTNAVFSVDMAEIGGVSISDDPITDMQLMFGKNEYEYAEGTITRAYLYNSSISDTTEKILYTSVSGASISTDGTTYTAYNATTGYSAEKVDAGTLYIQDSTGTATDQTVTVTEYYSEDTTLIEETESANELFISINHTSGANASEGYLEYDPASTSFLYYPVMSSTNENASLTFSNQSINISTGPLNVSEEHYYNITLQTAVEDFAYTVTWMTKTDTSASFYYSSNDASVPQTIALQDMDDSFMLIPHTYYLTYGKYDLLQTSQSESGTLIFSDVSPMRDGIYYISTEEPPARPGEFDDSKDAANDMWSNNLNIISAIIAIIIIGIPITMMWRMKEGQSISSDTMNKLTIVAVGLFLVMLVVTVANGVLETISNIMP